MATEMGADLDVDITPPTPEELATSHGFEVSANATPPGALEGNPHHIPPFEGSRVDFTKAKLTSVSALEIEDEVLKLDQLVRMVVEGRVTRVDHVVNDRTGKMERVHTIKILEGQLLNWDENP